jgi:hypothetical protein
LEPEPVRESETHSADWRWKDRLLGICPRGVRDSNGNWCPHVGNVVTIPLLLFTLLVCEFRCGEKKVKMTFIAVGSFQLYP